MSNKVHYITREIGIDMGHRVTHHGSKCRNLHGHRYTIQVTVRGPLFEAGEQEGMVLDYGFLKDIMMEHIDKDCDHGMCLYINDPWTYLLLPYKDGSDWNALDIAVKNFGFCAVNEPVGDKYERTRHENTGGKFYIVPFVPTAENLARHWFERLAPIILERTNNQGEIHSVTVFETPNCSAVYTGE